MEVTIQTANSVVPEHCVIDFMGCRLLEKFQLHEATWYCSCIIDVLNKKVAVLFLWGHDQPIYINRNIDKQILANLCNSCLAIHLLSISIYCTIYEVKGSRKRILDLQGCRLLSEESSLQVSCLASAHINGVSAEEIVTALLLWGCGLTHLYIDFPVVLDPLVENVGRDGG